MKNINLNFSPKKLQTSPGSPPRMTNTTMKQDKSFLFRLLSDLWQFETFCIISIQTLKCCRCHYYAQRGNNSLIYAQLSTLAWAACANTSSLDHKHRTILILADIYRLSIQLNNDVNKSFHDILYLLLTRLAPGLTTKIRPAVGK